jgi:hypothetical protein
MDRLFDYSHGNYMVTIVGSNPVVKLSERGREAELGIRRDVRRGIFLGWNRCPRRTPTCIFYYTEAEPWNRNFTRRRRARGETEYTKRRDHRLIYMHIKQQEQEGGKDKLVRAC